MSISNRLTYLIEQVPNDANVIDVAADHGYIAIELAKINTQRLVIASDVAVGPLNAGKKNALKQQITNIDFRLGDGLTVLTDADKVDCAIIAGIGGKLMRQILTDGREQPIPLFVLQANNDVELIRAWLYENDYHLIKDEKISDGKFIYECVVAQYRFSEKDTLYSNNAATRELQFYFGPESLPRDPEDMKLWLKKKIVHYQKQISQMKKSKQSDTLNRIAQYDKLILYANKLLEGYKS